MQFWHKDQIQKKSYIFLYIQSPWELQERDWNTQFLMYNTVRYNSIWSIKSYDIGNV